jgi:hypothetical protein
MSVKGMGYQRKILSITLDNASNNDAMVTGEYIKETPIIWTEFDSRWCLFPC